jgi:ABC-type polysaccharide/polyol phosphate transport system ATPase subunit
VHPFGIVGRNGSGRSSVLKCPAGIYRTDAGRIYDNGCLVDEILAVADAAFQQKCVDVLGKTVLFVTHDMATAQRFCHRAMLLEPGRVLALGDPEGVGDRYLELNFEGLGQEQEEGGAPAGDGAARVAEEL